MQSHIFLFFAFIFYLASLAVYGFALSRNRHAWEGIAKISVWIGFLFHSIGVLHLAFFSDHFPIYETYAFFAFWIILFHLLLSLRYSVSILSLFTLPFVLFLLLGHQLAIYFSETRNLLPGYWLSLHVLFTIIAYGAFAVGFAAGVGYLIQDRELKSHHPGKVFEWMPSLQVLDLINARALSLGFVLLTLGLLSGFFWAKSSKGQFWIHDPKLIWGLLIWIIYALLSLLRWRSLVRGRKVAYGSIIGFAVVIISYIGINHTIIN